MDVLFTVAGVFWLANIIGYIVIVPIEASRGLGFTTSTSMYFARTVTLGLIDLYNPNKDDDKALYVGFITRLHQWYIERLRDQGQVDDGWQEGEDKINKRHS